MAKAPRKMKLPPAAPLTPPAAPEVPIPDAPVPGVINPTTNQTDGGPTPSSEMPTGPLPPSATTVAPPETAQEAVERVKKGDYATDEGRQAAMKRWPHLFAETAEN